MGIAERVDRELGLTIVVWHGRVTPQDTVDHLVRLAANRYWAPGRTSLTDLRTATEISLPDRELVEILLEETDLLDVCNKAVLVRPEHLWRAAVRRGAAEHGMDATPFTEVDAACAHVGVDPARVGLVLDDLRAAIDAASFRMTVDAPRER